MIKIKRKLIFTDSNKGFTLVECLVALMILTVFVHGSLQIVKQSSQLKKEIRARHEQEWQIFLIQAEEKYRQYYFTKYNKDNYIRGAREGNEIFIEFYAPKKEIKLRENGGYQPVLTEVDQIIISDNQADSYLQMEVTFIDGTKKDGRFLLKR